MNLKGLGRGVLPVAIGAWLLLANNLYRQAARAAVPVTPLSVVLNDSQASQPNQPWPLFSSYAGCSDVLSNDARYSNLNIGSALWWALSNYITRPVRCEVLVRYPSWANAETRARLAIRHGASSFTALAIDQRTNGCVWLNVGTYDFVPGSWSAVVWVGGGYEQTNGLKNTAGDGLWLREVGSPGLWMRLCCVERACPEFPSASNLVHEPYSRRGDWWWGVFNQSGGILTSAPVGTFLPLVTSSKYVTAWSKAGYRAPRTNGLCEIRCSASDAIGTVATTVWATLYSPLGDSYTATGEVITCGSTAFNCIWFDFETCGVSPPWVLSCKPSAMGAPDGVWSLYNFYEYCPDPPAADRLLGPGLDPRGWYQNSSGWRAQVWY